MKARKGITMIAGISLWTLSSLAAFGPWNASSVAILVVSCAECAIGISTLYRFETNAFYAAMGLRGLANSILALVVWRLGLIPQAYLGTILFGTLALSFLLSFAPRIRSITAIAVRLRKFPAWFSETKAYRAMDITYTILWSFVWMAAAILFQMAYKNAAMDLIAIAGLTSEFICFIFIQASGYRYIEFLSGKAAKEAR